MLLDRAAIARRIPHQGSMCLLDQLVHCDAEQIVCCTERHLDPHNPLRNAQGLPATAGVEIAAQAMALHGALLADSASEPTQGYLASVRQLSLNVDWLDQCAGRLEIRARRLSAGSNSVLYGFSIVHEDEQLLNGRAAVILDAAVFGADQAEGGRQ
ncbi:MAG: hydroxymyristoyl-ACP dehydratase [Thauera sp.]|nr:hydroxymyristoyl-ACP dehydratase [Thauera sp.]